MLIAVLVWAAVFSWPTKNFDVYFCDVGQGDAIFIKGSNNFQMLIDGGPSSKVLECLNRGMPFWDRSINVIVLTHPHADHLTGLIEVIKRYNVGQILETDAVNNSPEYFEWQKLVQGKKVPVSFSYQVSAIDLGAGAKADVLYPKESYSAYAEGYGGSTEALREGGKDKNVSDLNTTSVIMRLNYAGVSFLLPGDADKEEQNRLLSTDYGLQSTFLKVPHHGSKTAMNNAFLNAVAPKFAIISVGKNQWGLPTTDFIDALQKMNVEIKRTDKNGTIKVEVKPNGEWKMN